jgi:hypothetical protein
MRPIPGHVIRITAGHAAVSPAALPEVEGLAEPLEVDLESDREQVCPVVHVMMAASAAAPRSYSDYLRSPAPTPRRAGG